MSNPFDFSDFGAVRAPSGGSAKQLATGSDTLVHSGFDPFSAAAPAKSVDSRGSVESGPLSGTPSGADFRVARPPLALLGLALAVAAAGIVTSLLLGHALPGAVTGWLLAGPVAIGALSAYSRIDTSRRTEAVYSAPGWTGAAYWAVVALSLTGIGFGAWYLALWAGGL